MFEHVLPYFCRYSKIHQFAVISQTSHCILFFQYSITIWVFLVPVSSFVQLFQIYRVRDRVEPSSKHLLLCFLLPFWWGLRCSSALLVPLLHRAAQCCAATRIAVSMPIFRNLITCLSAACFVIQGLLLFLPSRLLFPSKNDTFSHNPYDPVMLCLIFTLVPRDTPSWVGNGLNQKSFW